mmetsp:Transcript_19402/g.38117  ORF Transcript_19402/g.38117 Transcript_19402/m.38117 type:complete len:174 (-) Transcript_19402:391-912(-)
MEGHAVEILRVSCLAAQPLAKRPHKVVALWLHLDPVNCRCGGPGGTVHRHVDMATACGHVQFSLQAPTVVSPVMIRSGNSVVAPLLQTAPVAHHVTIVNGAHGLIGVPVLAAGANTTAIALFSRTRMGVEALAVQDLSRKWRHAKGIATISASSALGLVGWIRALAPPLVATL